MESGNDNLLEEKGKSWSDIEIDLLQPLLMCLSVFTRLTCAGISQHWRGRIGELTTTNAGLLRTSYNITTIDIWSRGDSVSNQIFQIL